MESQAKHLKESFAIGNGTYLKILHQSLEKKFGKRSNISFWECNYLRLIKGKFPLEIYAKKLFHGKSKICICDSQGC